MEIGANVYTTISHYYNVDFILEVDRWITIRDIFKLSKLYEIFSRTNFGLTEMAIASKNGTIFRIP